MAINKFMNPYTFYSLKGKVSNRKPFKSGSLFGYIDYTFITKTPLIIPNTTNNSFDCDSDFTDRSYGIFSYEDLSGKNIQSLPPVIPGSEVRGMIRSVYEALTNSCLVALPQDDVYISRRMRPKEANTYKPSILKYENDKWFLYEASQIKIKRNKFPSYNDKFDEVTGDRIINKSFKAFDCVRVKNCGANTKILFEKSINEFVHDNNSNLYLHIGNPFVGTDNNYNKYALSLFEINKTSKREVSIDQFIKLLRSFDKKNEKNEIVNLYSRYINGIKNKTTMTVYANILNKNLISPANIGRILYDKRYNQLCSDYLPCSDDTKLCSACRLFGNEINNGVGSRVRFLDMNLSDKFSYSQNTGTAYIVGATPNPQNFLFYGFNGRLDGGDWNDSNALIRGRKFYWHHKNIAIETIQKPVEHKNMYTKFKTIKKGIHFKGRVYFERLEDDELKNLVLSIGLGNDENYGHKLGHAKPFGYGSINTMIDSVYVYDSESSKYNDKTADYLNVKLEDLQLKNILGFNTLGDTVVCYPYVHEENSNVKLEIFKWFSSNKNKKIPQKLPLSIDGLKALSTYTVDSESKKHNTYNKKNYSKSFKY